MMKLFAQVFALGLSMTLAACVLATPHPAPDKSEGTVRVIFDTDFGGDADDLGALAMLHHYADIGAIDFLAVASWSNEQYAVPAIAAVNQYYGRPGLPLGVREVDAWRTEWNYSKAIVDRFPPDPAILERVAPAVALYRSLLEDADPQSITIVTVGPLANIRNLLRSGPDEISSSTGAELVAAKVDRFIIMGGQFPAGITSHGPEWNFDGNMEGVTQEVLEKINRPILFSGYEVGEALKYGAGLNQHPPDTPLAVGYAYFSAHAPWMSHAYVGRILDNSSFDQTAVMHAALGDENGFWTLSEPGTLSVDPKGVGTWSSAPDGQHRYLKLSGDLEATIAHLEMAMTH